MNASLYLLTVLIWGTTWIAIKLQLGEVAIPVSVFYRFALAGLLLWGALVVMGKLQRLDRRGHLLCLGQGLCLFCLNFLCFYTATQWIPSGLISVVFSAATIWNAINARIWFGTPISSRVVLGGVFGLAGLLLLFWPELATREASHETWLGLGLALLGTLCFSTGNMLSSAQQRIGIRPLTGNAYGMLYGSALLLAGCVASGQSFAFDTSLTYVGALLYLAVIGSVVGFTAYLTLVGRMGPARAAYCTVLFPVVALTISSFVEGYQWTATSLCGLALVMGGNVLVFARLPRRRAAQAA
ncbi:EamA family transporter [Bordetella genomosp. 5]|uniref:EamA family transporter n=1 Tax=Bordetella genomosp. 5 TaxID=1395608 RepID=A0A261TZT5_9BORD|nr:EamA family transporter [Bordetella genomosp. 5]OZI47203.1 EamA family transporter [Bordetella genomosp. 5]OZI55139.1 EamA family transporter [Bordetella genomosp. 5]